MADDCLAGYSQTISRRRHREQTGTAKSQRRLAATQAPQDLRRGGAAEARGMMHMDFEWNNVDFADTEQKNIARLGSVASDRVGPLQATSGIPQLVLLRTNQHAFSLAETRNSLGFRQRYEYGIDLR